MKFYKKEESNGTVYDEMYFITDDGQKYLLILAIVYNEVKMGSASDFDNRVIEHLKIEINEVPKIILRKIISSTFDSLKYLDYLKVIK